MYSPTLWAAKSICLQRTTNACESFHSRFNHSFYKESSPIIKWLTVLITEIQTDVYIKLRSTNISNHPQDHTVRNRQKKNYQINGLQKSNNWKGKVHFWWKRASPKNTYITVT